jgi:glutamate dehydrogenase
LPPYVKIIGFLPRSHRDKTLLNVLETYPRDELIEIAHPDLVRIASGIVALLRARAGAHLPARRRLGALCFGDRLYAARPLRHHHPRAHLGAPSWKASPPSASTIFVMLGESRLARLHFIARTPVGYATDRYDCRRDRKAGGAHRARLG